MSTEPVLSVRGLVKSYGERRVLDGVDLDVAEHQVVVLIGASGSGKSTLLRCVDLLEDIDDGQIFLDGSDISDPRGDADAARRSMGMVFQSFNLFPHMSVLANVTLAPRVVHGHNRAEAEQRGRELLDRVGLSEKADAYPDKLSGGQQQRVAIARALVNNPLLMLCDEPTAALDFKSVGIVMDELKMLSAAGKSVIVVTHDLRLKQFADRIIYVNNGVASETPPEEELFH